MLRVTQLTGLQEYTPPCCYCVLLLNKPYYPRNSLLLDDGNRYFFNLQGICCPSLISPFWSLSYEVWFYILLGVLAVLLTTKKDWVRVLGIILFVASASVYVLGLNYNYLFIWMSNSILGFMVKGSNIDFMENRVKLINVSMQSLYMSSEDKTKVCNNHISIDKDSRIGKSFSEVDMVSNDIIFEL